MPFCHTAESPRSISICILFRLLIIRRDPTHSLALAASATAVRPTWRSQRGECDKSGGPMASTVDITACIPKENRQDSDVGDWTVPQRNLVQSKGRSERGDMCIDTHHKLYR